MVKTRVIHIKKKKEENKIDNSIYNIEPLYPDEMLKDQVCVMIPTKYIKKLNKLLETNNKDEENKIEHRQYFSIYYAIVLTETQTYINGKVKDKNNKFLNKLTKEQLNKLIEAVADHIYDSYYTEETVDEIIDEILNDLLMDKNNSEKIYNFGIF